MKKHVVSALVAAFAATVGMAFEFEWEERDGGAVVTGCSGEASGLLEIPETLGGLPVRGIDYGAFEGQSGITSVSIPTNVEWIGMHAFAETKMFDNVTKPADVPVYSSDGKWLLGCRICYFTYKRDGATRKMHLPVDVNVKEGVEHLADGAFVGAEHRLQDGYTQFAAINSIKLPSSLKTVGSAICNDMHLGLKVDFPTGVVEVADDFLAGANGVQFRFLGSIPNVIDGRGWLDYDHSEIEGLSPAPAIVYYRDGADGWYAGGEFCGVTTWPRGCMEEDAVKIRLGDVHCFGKYDEDVFIERESRAWSGEWVAIPVTGDSKAAQLKPLLVPCGGADASLVGTPAVWTDAKMFNYVAKPIVKKAWSMTYWAEYGWGEVSFPPYSEYEDDKKDIDYYFPADLWPGKKAVANRFWIVTKVNASRGTWSGPQVFRIGLKGTPLYSEPFSANCGLSCPVAADGLFRGVAIESAGKLKFGGENTGNTGAPYDGAPRYSIEGKSPLVVKVSLGEAGTLVIAGGDEDCLEKGEMKISGGGIVSDVFKEERSLEDAEFSYRFGACPYIRRVSVSGATTLTLKLPYCDSFDFGRMRFFPANGRSVAIDAGCFTPYTEVGVANRMAFARGYVTGTGVYKSDELATLTAVPGEGEAFDHWEVKFGSLPPGTDLTSPKLSFVVPASACGAMEDEAQIFVRAVWKPRQSVTALPVPVGAATVAGNGQADANSFLDIEATRTGTYRFVDDDYSPTTCVSVDGADSDHESLAYVRLDVRPPREDWLWLDLVQTELSIAAGQALSNEVVNVDSGSEVTVTASGLPTGLAFDARANVLKGAPAKSGVHYITFTAKNANGFTDARVLRIVVDGAEESFQNGAKVYQEAYYATTPFDLTGLVVGEPIGTRTFYSQNYSISKLKVTGVPPGLKVKVQNGNGSGCGYCGGVGSITFSGTPSKVGAYKIVISGTYKKKTYKTVRTVVVQGRHSSLYMPVSLAADSVGRGTVSGGGVKAFASTVKLTAKSSNAKKYFFGGWYVGEDLEERLDAYISCNPRAESLSFAVAAKRVVYNDYWSGESVWFDYDGIEAVSENGIYARFVTKAEDPISIDAPAEWRVTTDNPLEVDVQSFSAYKLSVDKTAITTPGKKKKAAVSVSGNKLKVTNRSALKPGYHRLVLTAKNAAGNTCSFAVMAYVPNLTEAVDQGVLELDTSDEGYTIQAGKVVTFADLGIKKGSGAKITAISGLPTGMKWDAKKQRLTGLPTKGGTFTPVFTVKYSSYCLGNRTYTVRASATFNVTPLPESVVGKFSGYTYIKDEFGAGSRAVSVTATAGGKITAKVGSLTFSKTGWGEVEDDWAAVTFTATRTVGKGKSAKTYTDVLDMEVSGADWTDDGMSGTIKTYLNGDVVNADIAFVARKDVFASNEDAKTVAKSVAGTVKFGLQGAEAESGYAYDLVQGTGLTVTAKADGSVTLAGKIGSTSVSGSATLAVSDSGTATARFFSGKFVIAIVYVLEEGEVVSASGRVWKQ